MAASDDREKNKIAPATSLGGAPPQTGFAADDAHGPIDTMVRPSRQAGISPAWRAICQAALGILMGGLVG